MNENFRTVLVAQAERVLCVMPSKWSAKPIEWVRDQVQAEYDTFKHCEATTVKEQEWLLGARNWLCAYNSCCKDMVHINDSLLGIKQIQNVNNSVCLIVNCFDIDHYRSMPIVVHYGQTPLGKSGWLNTSQSAYYNSNSVLVSK